MLYIFYTHHHIHYNTVLAAEYESAFRRACGTQNAHCGKRHKKEEELEYKREQLKRLDIVFMLHVVVRFVL